MTALLEVEGLGRTFAAPGGWLAGAGRLLAVDRVSFSIDRGETFGLVGESGSGKSTLGRMIGRLLAPSAGSIRFAGQDWLALRGTALRAARAQVQMVFQSPYASLDPRWPIGAIVAEPLRTHRPSGRAAERQAVTQLLESVGLDAAMMHRFPHQLSGGQRQRVAIARAIALEPALLIADEPVSALDVSVQAQILALLREIRAAHGLAMLFISHDLSVVAYLADRVGVLYRGRLVEVGPSRALFAEPLHPYTEALLEAIPGNPRRRQARAAAIETATDAGCSFAPRCPYARDICRRVAPELTEISPGRSAACHRITQAWC